MFYLQKDCQALIVKMEEKSPCASDRGRGKLTILNYARAFCLPALKRNYFTEA